MNNSTKNIVIAPLDADNRWCTDVTWINRIDRENTQYLLATCELWRKDKIINSVEKSVGKLDCFKTVTLSEPEDIQPLIDVLESNCNNKAYVYILNNQHLCDLLTPAVEKIFAGVHNLKSINQLNKIRRYSGKEEQQKKAVENNGDIFGLMNQASVEVPKGDGKVKEKRQTELSSAKEKSDEEACNSPKTDEKKEPNDDVSTIITDNSEKDSGYKRRKKLEDKKPASDKDADKILKEKEKKIFGIKFENIEVNFDSSSIAKAKAALVNELQLRLIQNIDYMMPALKEKNISVEEYIGIINLFLITDDQESFLKNLKNKIKDQRLNFASEKMYPRLMAEVNYYKRVCDLLYSEDKWD